MTRTRQATITVKPRYVNQGNTHHYRTPSYRHQSKLGGKFERPASAFENALIIARIGLRPALGLAAFLAVPITLIIMFGDKL